MPEQLAIETVDEICVVRMQRPPANALALDLLAEGAELMERLRDDPPAAVVLTGSGKFFSGGVDLKVAPKLTEPEQREMVAGINRLFIDWYGFPRPVVAAVNGHAVGAGLELALSCDLVVVAREAKLRLPEASLGTFVGGGVTYTLARRVGELRARELLMLCPFVRGEDAVALGLANRVADAVDVLPTALDLAAELARRAPQSIRRLKALLHESGTVPPSEMLRREGDALLACMETRDWAEGIAAYHEKREPRFTGE